MAQDTKRLAAELAHRHGKTLSRGDPTPPQITLASTYHLPGDPGGVPSYGRSDNASWKHLEEALGLLEEAPALVFPSGMAAISAAFFATLKAGDRVLIPSDGYYTTRYLLDRVLARFGVAFDVRPTRTFLDGGFAGYSLVYVETPANPSLDICDIRAVAAGAHAAGALVVADNTTMTPFGQRPLDLGVDIVVASDTKAPNGHADTLLGHLASRSAAVMDAAAEWRKLSGSIPSGFDAWLVHRGLETLELRFDRMCRSAQTIAERLAGHKAVMQIRYPGLPDDPAHNLASTQMLRFGSLIGLTLADRDTAEALIAACPLIRPTTSFGSVHSSAERRARWGDAVAPGFVRLSVGCEPLEELLPAIEQALDAVAARG